MPYDPKDPLTHPNNMSVIKMVFSNFKWIGKCQGCGALRVADTQDDLANPCPCECDARYESVGWAPKGTMVVYHEMAVAG